MYPDWADLQEDIEWKKNLLGLMEILAVIQIHLSKYIYFTYFATLNVFNVLYALFNQINQSIKCNLYRKQPS